jgi:hypothetical protein
LIPISKLLEIQSYQFLPTPAITRNKCSVQGFITTKSTESTKYFSAFFAFCG